MSLAMIVDAGNAEASRRLTASMGVLMSGALLMATWESWLSGLPLRYAVLQLLAATGCTAWCLIRLRRARRLGQWVSLHVAPGGDIRLVDRAGGQDVDVDVAMSWTTGPLIYLRLRPRSAGDALKSADCPFLFARWSFSAAQWHGLRRVLVWYRRSGHRVPVPA